MDDETAHQCANDTQAHQQKGDGRLRVAIEVRGHYREEKLRNHLPQWAPENMREFPDLAGICPTATQRCPDIEYVPIRICSNGRRFCENHQQEKDDAKHQPRRMCPIF
jgi:hypothetical protein